MTILNKLFGSDKNKPGQDEGSEKNKVDQTGTNKRLDNLLKILAPFKRQAYIPKTVEVNSTFSPTSKIGGLPYLRSKEDWPVCPNCQNHMQLFLQLNMEELPAENSPGLVQLFYCITNDPLCESDQNGYMPFSKNSIGRKIQVDGPSEIIKPSINELFPERKITSWQAKDDYPHYEEYSHLGINLELDDELFDLMHQHKIGKPLPGDKLYGWPYWIQGKENPSDRQTGTMMELLFQLDSEVNLPFMFGDMGVGHLTESPDNKEELAFGWACN